MQAVKYRVGHSIRRDSIATNDITLASINSTFSELFGRPLHSNESFRYRDDVQEWIDVSSDRELREAIRLNKDKTLELMTVRTPFMFPPQHPLSPREKTWGRSWRRTQDESLRHEESKNEESTSKPNNFIGRRFYRPFRHPAVCDNCKEQIVGERHKCNECNDYDLCQACIDKTDTVHFGHTFTILSRSYSRWHHRHRDNKTQEKEVDEERQEPVVERQPSTEPELTVLQPETVTEDAKEQNNEENETPIERKEPTVSPVQNHPLQGSVIMEAMHALTAMGFQDKQKNVRLYLACGGDLQEVMNKLLDE